MLREDLEEGIRLAGSLVGTCQSAASSSAVRMKCPRQGKARCSTARITDGPLRRRFSPKALAPAYTPNVAAIERATSRAAATEWLRAAMRSTHS